MVRSSSDGIDGIDGLVCPVVPPFGRLLSQPLPLPTSHCPSSANLAIS